MRDLHGTPQALGRHAQLARPRWLYNTSCGHTPHQSCARAWCGLRGAAEARCPKCGVGALALNEEKGTQTAEVADDTAEGQIVPRCTMS